MQLRRVAPVGHYGITLCDRYVTTKREAKIDTCRRKGGAPLWEGRRHDVGRRSRQERRPLRDHPGQRTQLPHRSAASTGCSMRGHGGSRSLTIGPGTQSRKAQPAPRCSTTLSHRGNIGPDLRTGRSTRYLVAPSPGSGSESPIGQNSAIDGHSTTTVRFGRRPPQHALTRICEVIFGHNITSGPNNSRCLEACAAG